MELVRNLSVKTKINLLIVLPYLNRNLKLTYSKIIRKAQKRSIEAENSLLYEDNKFQVISDLNINIPESSISIKVYKTTSTLILLVNSIKFLLLFLILDLKKLPIEWNCHIWGRSNLSSLVTRFSRLQACFISVIILSWRFVFQFFDFEYELDSIMFLLQDAPTIKEESKLINNLNEQIKFSCAGKIEKSNFIQAILYYRVNYGNFYVYKLRSNRTEESRKRLVNLLDTYYFISIITAFVFFFLLSVSCFLSIIENESYTQSYPTCCPQLESLLNDRDSPKIENYSLGSCDLRNKTIFFDLVDSLALIAEFFLILIPVVLVATLISEDLSIQWETIRESIRNLVKHLRFKSSIYSELEKSTQVSFDFLYNLHNVRYRNHLYQMEVPDFHHNPKMYHEEDIIELMASLSDFFNCFARANRFISLVLTLLVLLFIVTMGVISYFLARAKERMDILVLGGLVISIYVIIVISTIGVLRLKQAISSVHVDLCSLMALDKSYRKKQWMSILDKFNEGSKNSFTLLTKARFTWSLVANLVVTSLSFLILIESHKV